MKKNKYLLDSEEEAKFISFFQKQMAFTQLEEIDKYYFVSPRGTYIQYPLMRDDLYVMHIFFYFLFNLLNKTEEYQINKELIKIEFKKALTLDPTFSGLFISNLLLRISYLFLDLDYDEVRFAEENKNKRCIIEDFFSCFFQLNPLTIREKENECSDDIDASLKSMKLHIDEKENLWMPFEKYKSETLEYKLKGRYCIEGQFYKEEYLTGFTVKSEKVKAYYDATSYKPLKENTFQQALPEKLIPLYISSFKFASLFLGYNHEEENVPYCNSAYLDSSVFYKLVAEYSKDNFITYLSDIKMFYYFTDFPYIYPQIVLLQEAGHIEAFVKDLVKKNGPYRAGNILQTHLDACYTVPYFSRFAKFINKYKEERTLEYENKTDALYEVISNNVRFFRDYFTCETIPDIYGEFDRDKITRAVGIIK